MRAPLTIGLVNNMADAALAATERQFTDLLTAAADGREVIVRLFSLPNMPRSDYMRNQMRGRYASLEGLAAAKLDALIVTGAEPRTADLKAEPYFPALAWLADWAEANTLSTLWSCLAAHAAVLHLDGVKRRPRSAKLSGVFDAHCTRLDPLTQGFDEIAVPHSRLNELDARDLEEAGYEILTRSDAAGVDAFVRHGKSLFVFLQGHPEYDADSLCREYLRDVGCFLKGERPTAPLPPANYFAPEVATELRHLTGLAERMPGHGLMSRFAAVATAPAHAWRQGAVAFYANWIGEIAARKAAQATVAEAATA
ncbi:MAG TPA: homoserine O-succinyltransferase [Caulobacteraceae bacterium]|nr:homoserine O-succinyltransferase [Caulobacteraceae bacterium]